MTETTKDLIARLMQHVEDTMCEAEVDYSAGHLAGASVSYDSDFLQTCFETELAAALARDSLAETPQESLVNTVERFDNGLTVSGGGSYMWPYEQGKYVRYDDYAAVLVREAALLAALTVLVNLNENHSPFGGEIYQDRVDRAWDTARALVVKP